MHRVPPSRSGKLGEVRGKGLGQKLRKSALTYVQKEKGRGAKYRKRKRGDTSSKECQHIREMGGEGIHLKKKKKIKFTQGQRKKYATWPHEKKKKKP